VIRKAPPDDPSISFAQVFVEASITSHTTNLPSMLDWLLINAPRPCNRNTSARSLCAVKYLWHASVIVHQSFGSTIG